MVILNKNRANPGQTTLEGTERKATLHTPMTNIVSILHKGGGFLAHYFAHRHAAKLAREQRLADYEGFLSDWEQRIERSSPSDLYAAYFSEGQALFRSRA